MSAITKTTIMMAFLLSFLAVMSGAVDGAEEIGAVVGCGDGVVLESGVVVIGCGWGVASVFGVCVF